MLKKTIITALLLMLVSGVAWSVTTRYPITYTDTFTAGTKQEEAADSITHPGQHIFSGGFIATELTTVEDSVNDLETLTSTHADSINTLEDTVSTNEGVISDNADSINTNEGLLSDHADSINTAEDTIAILEAGIQRTATFVVVASNASALSIANSDYQCNGTDDQVQIQAAIDACPAVGIAGRVAGNISLTEGRFYINAPIIMKGNNRLSGDNMYATTLSMVAGSDTDMFRFDQVYDLLFFTIENMYLVGNEANMASGMCINTSGTGSDSDMFDLHLRHLFISSFNDTAIELDIAWGAVIDDVIIEYGTGPGIEIQDNADAKITNCKIISNAGSAIVMQTDAASVRVINSYLGNDTTDPIVSFIGNSGALIGCDFVSTNTDGIGVQISGSRNRVVGCHFAGLGTGADASDTAINLIAGASYTIATGNAFNNSTWDATYDDNSGANAPTNVFAINSADGLDYSTLPDAVKFNTYGEYIHNSTDGRIQMGGTGHATYNNYMYFDFNDENMIPVYASVKRLYTSAVGMADGIPFGIGSSSSDFSWVYQGTTNEAQFVEGNVQDVNVVMRFSKSGDTVSIERQLELGSDTDHTTFDTDGRQTMEGDARVIQHMDIGAGSFTPGNTPPTAGFLGLFPILGFASNTSDEAQYSTWIPYRWDSSTEIGISIVWAYTTAGDSGPLQWNVDYACIADGEDPSATTATVSQYTTGEELPDIQITTTFATGIIAANAADHDSLGLKIWRDHDDNGDTMAAAAKLIEVHLHFTCDKLGKDINP